MNSEKSLNEECGIFGVFGSHRASELTYLGLFSLQHRGQEGCGILSNINNIPELVKGSGLVSDVFKEKREYLHRKSDSAIGHTRYSTQGENNINNVQPFLFQLEENFLGIAHNGNLTNARTLKKNLEMKGQLFSSTSDSEILAHLIMNSKQETFVDKLKEALNIIKGSFAYIILTKDRMYAALDPNGFRPLSVGKLLDGGFVVSSETCALDTVGAKLVTEVKPGQLVTFDKNEGMSIVQYTDDISLNICSLEYIYLSRPDSIIHGVSVYEARQRAGKILASESQIDGDIVVPIPSSAIEAALGYSKASGIPLETCIIKNQYSLRTFIEPTQNLRTKGIIAKLSVVSEVVKYKKVIVVDDSLIRGTTTKRVVRLLRDSGAKEVHVLIASPPFKYPCYYGIDIQDSNELLSAKYSVSEVRDIIGADSLCFLSEEGFLQSVGHNGLTMSYFNGNYPTPLYDYE